MEIRIRYGSKFGTVLLIKTRIKFEAKREALRISLYITGKILRTILISHKILNVRNFYSTIQTHQHKMFKLLHDLK